MKLRLGVTIRLLAALDNQIEGGLEGDGTVKPPVHRLVERVRRILTIHCDHALRRGDKLIFRDQPVMT